MYKLCSPIHVLTLPMTLELGECFWQSNGLQRDVLKSHVSATTKGVMRAGASMAPEYDGAQW